MKETVSRGRASRRQGAGANCIKALLEERGASRNSKGWKDPRGGGFQPQPEAFTGVPKKGIGNEVMGVYVLLIVRHRPLAIVPATGRMDCLWQAVRV